MTRFADARLERARPERSAFRGRAGQHALSLALAVDGVGLRLTREQVFAEIAAVPEQAKLEAKHPSTRVPPLWTLRLPVTVSGEDPNAAISVEPFPMVRFPLIVVGPASTAQAPEILTCPE